MYNALTYNRSLGINFNEGYLPAIKVWAPHARSLVLEVEGKGNYRLEKMPYGYWQASCNGLEPGDRYKLNLNGKNKLPDPASLSQPGGVHEASECVDLNEIRKIKGEKWDGIPLEELIIYEIHVGTFTREGTFEAIHGKLDYLESLGVNAIELMPVAQFSGNRNWGYDGVFPFAVHQSYGGAKELAKLVKACHEKGIAVILDVVYNHLGPEGNYLINFGPYLTRNYMTPWGKAINFDDMWCDGVRQYFLENALMWLRDFHIDGLRIDAIHTMRDISPVHFLRELSQNVQKLNKDAGRNHFLIAESDLNDTRVINPLNEDGYGMDSQWCDDFHHALHALTTGERKGYYIDYGSFQQMVKSFNNAYVYDGNFSEYRKKFFGTSTTNQPGEKFIVYTQNHDQVGNRMWGDRLGALVDFETLKLAAGAMFMSPFLPMIFMGEEYGEDAPFLFFTDHSNEHLAQQIRKGRKREFRDFYKKNTEPPDPQSKETFQKSKLRWNYKGVKQKELLLEFYKKCIQFRKTHKALKPGSRTNIYARKSNDENAIVLVRKYENELLVVLMNFSDKLVKEKLPEITGKNAKLLLYSAQKRWGGNADNSESPLKQYECNKYSVSLEARSIIVFLCS